MCRGPFQYLLNVLLASLRYIRRHIGRINSQVNNVWGAGKDGQRFERVCVDSLAFPELCCHEEILQLQSIVHSFNSVISNACKFMQRNDSWCRWTRFWLFRLLGANAAADVLQLTSTLSNAAPGRLHLVSGDELRVLTRGDEPLFEDLFNVRQIPVILPSFTLSQLYLRFLLQTDYGELY